MRCPPPQAANPLFSEAFLAPCATKARQAEPPTRGSAHARSIYVPRRTTARRVTARGTWPRTSRLGLLRPGAGTSLRGACVPFLTCLTVPYVFPSDPARAKTSPPRSIYCQGIVHRYIETYTVVRQTAYDDDIFLSSVDFVAACRTSHFIRPVSCPAENENKNKNKGEDEHDQRAQPFAVGGSSIFLLSSLL